MVSCVVRASVIECSVAIHTVVYWTSCSTDVELCVLWTASVRVLSESKEEIIFAEELQWNFRSRTVRQKTKIISRLWRVCNWFRTLRDDSVSGK